MRHGTTTIAIRTTEQAEKMLEHLENCRESARSDNYASERVKPIKGLTCTCCGEWTRGREWWNQEPGIGLCDSCVPRCCGPIEAGQENETHGVAGLHFLVPQEELDNPPLVADRGYPLYGIDDRLRIESDGYVFWKGREIEHFSGSAMYDFDENKMQARELIRRCEILEGRGEEVSTTSVVWTWGR